MEKEKTINIQKIKSYLLGAPKDRIPLLLVYALLVTAIFYNSGLPGVYLMILIYLVISKNTWRKFKLSFRHPFVKATTFFFLWQAITLLYTDDMAMGHMKLESKTPFFVLPLFLFSIYRSFWKKNAQRIIDFTIGLTTSTAIFLLLRSVYRVFLEGGPRPALPNGGFGQYFFLYTQLSDFVAHPAYLSLFVSMAAFLVIYKTMNKLMNKKLGIVLFSFLFLFNFMLLSRGSLLAFLFVMGIGLTIYILKSRSYKLLSLLFIPVIGILVFVKLAPPSMTHRITNPLNLDYNIQAESKSDFNGLTIRLAEWECAREAIEKNIIWGSGLGDSNEALYQTYEQKGFKVGMFYRFNCHNQFLETWLSTGIIGLALLLLITGIPLFYGIQNQNYLLIATIGLSLIAMMPESLLERQMGMFFLLFFSCFFMLSSLHKK